jgi:hypothetical protein
MIATGLRSVQQAKKERLGDKMIALANTIKAENDLQIKITSRILDSAAQIADNHDRLITEVVEMVNDDLVVEVADIAPTPQEAVKAPRKSKAPKATNTTPKAPKAPRQSQKPKAGATNN